MQVASTLQEYSAYSTFAATIWLILRRPRIGFQFRVRPVYAAALGVGVLALFGLLSFSDFLEAAKILVSPLITIASIMAISSVADRLGVFHWLASIAEQNSQGSVSQFFRMIFIVAALCSAVLNNDTTILMFTPLVITLVRRLYPDQPQLLVPFAFAVFMACGASPFIVSNPMNMVVASIAKLDFNQYAKTMIPNAIVACTASYFMLRLIYRKTLSLTIQPARLEPFQLSQHQGCTKMILLLLIVFSLYPLISWLHGPIWLVAACGALMAIILAAHQTDARPVSILRKGVSWETLGFLVGVFLLGAGLRNAGIVQRITEVYQNAGVFTIGIVSALGSALMDNHPMAIVNIMALGGPTADQHKIFAALIGGDLGPRMLPMGSLAGLIWMTQLERSGVHLSVLRFFKIGTLVMIPTLLLCLAFLLLI